MSELFVIMQPVALRERDLMHKYCCSVFQVGHNLLPSRFTTQLRASKWAFELCDYIKNASISKCLPLCTNKTKSTLCRQWCMKLKRLSNAHFKKHASQKLIRIVPGALISMQPANQICTKQQNPFTSCLGSWINTRRRYICGEFKQSQSCVPFRIRIINSPHFTNYSISAALQLHIYIYLHAPSH